MTLIEQVQSQWRYHYCKHLHSCSIKSTAPKRPIMMFLEQQVRSHYPRHPHQQPSPTSLNKKVFGPMMLMDVGDHHFTSSASSSSCLVQQQQLKLSQLCEPNPIFQQQKDAADLYEKLIDPINFLLSDDDKDDLLTLLSPSTSSSSSFGCTSSSSSSLASTCTSNSSTTPPSCCEVPPPRDFGDYIDTQQQQPEPAPSAPYQKQHIVAKEQQQQQLPLLLPRTTQQHLPEASSSSACGVSGGRTAGQQHRDLGQHKDELMMMESLMNFSNSSPAAARFIAGCGNSNSIGNDKIRQINALCQEGVQQHQPSPKKRKTATVTNTTTTANVHNNVSNSMNLRSRQLHLACCLGPAATVQQIRSILKQDPDAASRPIHVKSIKSVYSPLLPSRINKLVKEPYTYPLNLAIRYGCNSQVLNCLIAAAPQILAIPDGQMEETSLSILIKYYPSNNSQVTFDKIVSLLSSALKSSSDGVYDDFILMDRRGNTPLHIVACTASSRSIPTSVVKRLYSDLNGRKCIKLCNFNGQTPVDIARSRTASCNDDVARYLLSRGR